MQETLVWSLGQEDPLEKGTTTHSSTFAWKIPWTEEPGGLQSIESKRARPDWRDWAQHRSTIHRYNFFFFLVMRTFKILFSSNFQIRDTVFSATVAILYLTSPWHLLYNGILCFSYLLHLPLATTSLFFVSMNLFFGGERYCFLFLCFRFYVYVRSCGICLSPTCFT